MTDYKQVPAYPTPEMIAALGFGGDVELAIGHAALSDDIERAYKAMLAAAPAVQVEPVAWIVRHPHFCGKFTDDKEIAAHWESQKQGCTTPLFAEQQPAREWQPIKTAPKTKLFLGYVPHSCGGYVCVFIWNKNLKKFQNNIDGGCDNPTHWMPLPAPPEGGES